MENLNNNSVVELQGEVKHLLRKAMEELRAGNLEEAINFAVKAREKSDRAHASIVFAAVAHATGRNLDAINILNQAAKMEPEVSNYAEALASIFLKLGQKSDGLYNLKLGTFLKSDPFLDEIIGDFFGDIKQIFNSFIENRPLVAARLMVGQGFYVAAIKELETYVGLSGGDAESFALMAESAIQVGLLEHAEIAFAALKELQPSHPKCDYFSLAIEILRGDEHNIAKIVENLGSPPSLEIGLLLFHLAASTPMVPPTYTAKLSNDIALLVKSIPDVDDFVIPSKKVQEISFGFICGNISASLEHILINLNERIPINLYILGTIGSQSLRRLKATFEDVREVSAVDDATLIEMIRADEISVLFDCIGAGRFARPSLWKSRMARTQVLWAFSDNYDNSELYDYRLVDDVEASFIDKRLINLGLPLAFPVAPAELMGPIAEARNLKVERDANDGGALRLIAPHPVAILLDHTLDIYLSVLTAVPNATLSFVAASDIHDPLVARILARAENFGCADRIDLIDPISYRSEHHELLLDADLVLDSFPFGNVDLVTECIWVGIPVLTVLGQTERERISARMLQTVGLFDLITASEVEFVQKATALLEDRSEYERLRSLMRGADNRLKIDLYAPTAKALVAKFQSL